MGDEEFLKNYRFNVYPAKAIFNLFSKTISIQATLSSLKILFLKTLKNMPEKMKRNC